MCKQWTEYDQESMGICIKYVKSVMLPAEVFADSAGGAPQGPTERKPKRGKSVKKSPVSGCDTDADTSGVDLMQSPPTVGAQQQAAKKRKSSFGGGDAD